MEKIYAHLIQLSPQNQLTDEIALMRLGDIQQFAWEAEQYKVNAPAGFAILCIDLEDRKLLQLADAYVSRSTEHPIDWELHLKDVDKPLVVVVIPQDQCKTVIAQHFTSYTEHIEQEPFTGMVKLVVITIANNVGVYEIKPVPYVRQ